MDKQLAEMEEALLGNAPALILAEQEKTNPIISHYQFEREVVDLLAGMFNPDLLLEYSHYVGELTKPLNVVDDQDRHKVLFQVPPLVLMPRAAIPDPNGFTFDGYLNAMQRDRNLGRSGVEHDIVNSLLRLTAIPDYRETVINPINQILSRYGRHIAGIEATEASSANQAPQASTFGDDYEDD